MRKANILLLAVLFLAIGAGIFYIFASEGKNVSDPGASAETSTATPAPTATPETVTVATPEGVPAVAPELTPTFEPTPVLTPIPSPTPSPEPTPTPHVDHTAVSTSWAHYSTKLLFSALAVARWLARR